MTKILLTGATGFLGCYLLDKLTKDYDSTDIYCLVRQESIAKIDKYPVNIIEDDLRNKITLDRICENIDVVIHLASILDSNDPSLEVVNVGSSLNLVKNMNQDAKLIYLSSITVNYPIRTQYADSKLIVEQAIQRSDIRYTIIRPAWIYGNKSQSFEKLLSYAKKSTIIPIINQTIQPIFVEDVVNLIIDAIEKYDNKVIEIAGEKMKYKQFIRKIANHFGHNPVILEMPYTFFLSVFYISKVLPIKILTKDSLKDFKFSTNVDIEILQKKYNVSPRTIDEVLSEELIS